MAELSQRLSELGRHWLVAETTDQHGDAATWFSALRTRAATLLVMIETLQASPAPSFVQLSVLLQELKRLAQLESGAVGQV